MNARTADRVATALFWLGAILLVALLGGLLGYIVYHGGRHITWDFLTSPPETIRAGGGIGPQLFNSLYLLILSMAITVLIGLPAGIFLAEYARPGLVTEAVRFSIETLSSLPSIVVGLFGLLVFVVLTGWGYSLMAGALALTVINLPLIVRVSEEAIRSVPHDLREGSLALGASQWQTIWKVVMPCAFPGILTGVIIAAGRVFGEAAALLYTAGMSSPRLHFGLWNPAHPSSPLNPFRPAETLAVHIWKVNAEGLIPDLRRVGDGAAAVLVLVVLGFNLGARWLGRRIHRRLTAA
ncbi:MAG: phosphate ABC transporter permease PstA [Bacillota bacterium]